MRDLSGVLAPASCSVWCAGDAAPASVNGLTFVGLARGHDRLRRLCGFFPMT